MTFKELRKKKNITQIAIAKKLGINQSAVSMWENGKSQPRTKDLTRIAQAMSVSLAELVKCFKGA